MKKSRSLRVPGVVIVIHFATLLGISAAYAGSATWNLNPTSGDWNTAANWMPATVPNGPADVATFDLSNTAEISLSANTEVNGVVFNPGASAFNITTPPDVTLTISGAGITNNSGVIQNFAVTVARPFSHGLIVFSNNATAGSGTIFTLSGGTRREAVGGLVQFFDTSTAGNGTFNTSGGTVLGAFGSNVSFFDSSTGGNGIFTFNSGTANGSGGGFSFFNRSSAGHAVFTIHGGAEPVTEGGAVSFFNTASAGSGVFTVDGAVLPRAGSSSMLFENFTTAADAIVTVNSGAVAGADGAAVILVGSLPFSAPTAGNGTFTVNGGLGKGGRVDLQGDAAGASAHLKLFGNGFLTIAQHNAPGTTVGSLEGDGLVVLGANNLAVGADNLSTLFSGVISDDDGFGHVGGSFSKIGSGTLKLTGANLYPGGTTISDGTLVVSNTSGSGTGTGAVQVDAGTLGGKGIIAGAVTVGTGSGTGAFLAPGAGARKTNTLTIQSALTIKADGTYSYRVKTKRAEADQVIANGVTIESGAQFSFKQLANKQLTAGTVFSAIDNTAATPISGTFANLPDDSTFTIGNNTYQADYQGGDGNNLTLTVVP